MIISDKIIGFVIGNGESRAGVDLQELHSRGMTFGCNALHRDFAPDFLGCLDTAMAEEIVASGYHNRHTFCYGGRIAGQEFRKLPPTRWGLTGEAMIKLAISMRCSPIILVGFDFASVVTDPATKKKSVNNIYNGTDNYLDDPLNMGPHHGISMFNDIANENPGIKFYTVSQVPRALKNQLSKIELGAVLELPIINAEWRKKEIF